VYRRRRCRRSLLHRGRRGERFGRFVFRRNLDGDVGRQRLGLGIEHHWQAYGDGQRQRDRADQAAACAFFFRQHGIFFATATGSAAARLGCALRFGPLGGGAVVLCAVVAAVFARGFLLVFTE